MPHTTFRSQIEPVGNEGGENGYDQQGRITHTTVIGSKAQIREALVRLERDRRTLEQDAVKAFGPLAQLVEQGTFNPKVAGSTPARPTWKALQTTIFLPGWLGPAGLCQHGSSTRLQSDGEGALHLCRLELAFRTFPVAVNVRRHFER